MTLRLTTEEKEERAYQRRLSRERAKDLAEARECGRYIVCYNQAQLDAAIKLFSAGDAFTPKLCAVLELRRGTFVFDGATEFEVSQLLVTEAAVVGFKQVSIDTSHGMKITKKEEEEECTC